MPVPAVRLRLPPDRRRMAKSTSRLIEMIGISDAKQYARNKPFTPIFPTDDQALQDAVLLVWTRLQEVLTS